MPLTSFHFEAWNALKLIEIEQALDEAVSLTVTDSADARLCQAMRYAVQGGGKRVRPLLVLAACEAVSGSKTAAMRAACAVELIHAYSLVHDDMPCMDNDVLRRGKPTVHIQFGQAQALLAGDALQALAFELLTPDDASIDMATQALLCRILARAVGCQGMAGGQAIDLASVGHSLSLEQLQHMHRLKTGALLQAAVMLGAACGSCSSAALAALAQYGALLGLAFQVVDDILDVTADSAVLGKTAGKDAQNDKPTFVALLGLQASQDYAETLLDQALQALQHSALPNTQALRALAGILVHRKN